MKILKILASGFFLVMLLMALPAVAEKPAAATLN